MSNTRRSAQPVEQPHGRRMTRVSASVPENNSPVVPARKAPMERAANGETLLHQAAAKGDVKQVDCLLKQCDDPSGAVVMKTDATRLTPLHLASQNGHAKVVRRLITAGGARCLLSVDADGLTAVTSHGAVYSTLSSKIAFPTI